MIVRDLRRHVATLAGDLLALRRKLDPELLGNADYAAALATLAEGVEKLQELARSLEWGVPNRPSPEAPAFGDLEDGELVG